MLTLIGDDPLNPDHWQKESSPVFKMDASIDDFYKFTKDSFKVEDYKFHPFDFEIPMAI